MQNDFVKDIKEKLDKNATIGYWGWYKAPEISWFVDNHFVDVSHSASDISLKANDTRVDYVIISPYQDAESGVLLKRGYTNLISEKCSEKLCYFFSCFDNPCYKLYSHEHN
jgi:hypothetical protein